MDPAEINTAIDSNPGSAFDLVRIAEDIDRDTARLISESSDDLPGRRRRRRGASPVHRRPADVADPRLHGPGLGRAALRRSRNGLPARRPARQGRASKRRTRPSSAASTAPRPSSATPAARRPRCSRRITQAAAGRLADAHDRHARPSRRPQKALKWAMKAIGIKRGVVIAMNPQTGEVLAMVSLPTYDNNLFARGISTKAFQKLAQEPGHAAAQPRDPGALPAGIDLQARDRVPAPSPTARSRRRPRSRRRAS